LPNVCSFCHYARFLATSHTRFAEPDIAAQSFLDHRQRFRNRLGSASRERTALARGAISRADTSFYHCAAFSPAHAASRPTRPLRLRVFFGSARLGVEKTSRERVCLAPQRVCRAEWIRVDLCPPCCFVAISMNFAVMPAAQGDRELITHPSSECSALRKSEVVRIGRTPAAN
jgi:hypothetical protein